MICHGRKSADTNYIISVFPISGLSFRVLSLSLSSFCHTACVSQSASHPTQSALAKQHSYTARAGLNNIIKKCAMLTNHKHTGTHFWRGQIIGLLLCIFPSIRYATSSYNVLPLIFKVTGNLIDQIKAVEV